MLLLLDLGPGDQADRDRRLRGILKRCLRDHGARCVRVEELHNNTMPAVEPGRST